MTGVDPSLGPTQALSCGARPVGSNGGASPLATKENRWSGSGQGASRSQTTAVADQPRHAVVGEQSTVEGPTRSEAVHDVSCHVVIRASTAPWAHGRLPASLAIQAMASAISMSLVTVRQLRVVPLRPPRRATSAASLLRPSPEGRNM